MSETESPLTRLTLVDYFHITGENYEAADALVRQLATESGLAITQILDPERGDQVIALIALGMGPVEHVELVDPSVQSLADAHGIRNIVTPALGYAYFLPQGHPLRQTFEKIHERLKLLFWPI
jgi:hypothetical protein